jgi:hypothetical protein
VSFVFQDVARVFSLTVNVYDLDHDADFGVLQSRAHEYWARSFGSFMKDDLRYTPSTCFETFPFPAAWRDYGQLASIGGRYDAIRSSLMAKNGEGLTTTYNRFHDPNERDPNVQELRDLHAIMDRAVLDAYGWSDIALTNEYILDYEDDEEGEPGQASRRKKPWRYRWPDEVRDEVLGRLLALNATRATGGGSSGKASERTRSSKVSDNRMLFDANDDPGRLEPEC